MKTLRILGIAAILLAIGVGSILADNRDRIYGKIVTVDGDEFQGLIRWDKNEACWYDILNGNKELSRDAYRSERDRRRKYSDRGRSVELFGVRIGANTNWDWSGSAQSGLRMGHIKRMEAVHDDEMLVTLKSGKEVELSGGSTDIGSDIREIIVEDASEGEIEFVWEDIDYIEFMPAPNEQTSRFGERLYGTLTTRRGDEYTGWVTWDVDEIFPDDILDGDEGRRKRKIEFGKIKAIERYSSSGATVFLASGDEVLLRESNDVDDSNRGIMIADLGFGQVRVPWDEFDRLEFKAPPSKPSYKDFDGGKELQGTVTTEDGESYTGMIRWDNDEEFSWELLDGEADGLEFDIEMGLIKNIEKRSRRRANVTVWDGRTFRLGDSNDVDDDNKGIYIHTSGGEDIYVDWEEFEKIEFAKK